MTWLWHRYYNVKVIYEGTVGLHNSIGLLIIQIEIFFNTLHFFKV